MTENEPIEPAAEPVRPAGRRSRRTTVVAVLTVVVLAVLATGGWAVVRFLDGGGPQPDTVLPADTIAYLSVDLDPSASQKIEAFRLFRKFPELREQLGLDDDDDLRRYVVDELVEETGCEDVDYADDVGPWIGDRGALAAVDLGNGKPTPALAIQTDDPDAATAALDRIAACAGEDDVGYALSGDYLVVSDSAEHADAIVAAAEKRPLADAEEYRRWTGEVGDRGVISFFVAQGAAEMALDRIGPLAGVDDVFDGFAGLAGTVRFDDGGAEVAVAAGGLEQVAGPATVGEQVGRLPADTAAALGLGISDDYAATLVDQLDAADGGLVAQAETQTGLDLPEDLQTLLGDALVLSVDGEAPEAALSPDALGDLAAAITVTGEPDRVHDVLAKIEERLGVSLADLGFTEQQEDDRITLSTGSDYATKLLGGEGGTLAADDAFTTVVPEADQASSILFLQLTDSWRDAIVTIVRSTSGEDEAAMVERNLAPLGALGAASWRDGDVAHISVKLTTR